MKHLVYILLSLSTYVLFSQTANVQQGCAPMDVTFTAPSGSGTYFWDFKNGDFGNDREVFTIYETPGVYDVEFRESETGPVIGTVQIEVYEKPVPSVAVSQAEGCAPLTVTFTDNTDFDPNINFTSGIFDFQDSQGTVKTGTSASYTYSSAGEYTLRYSINTNYESCNGLREIEVVKLTNRPNARFAVNQSLTTCDTSLTVSINNTSTGSEDLNYQWDFGNGITSEDEDISNLVYNEGTYTLSLTASYENGCSDTHTETVSVGAPKPSIILSSDTVCADSSISNTMLNFSTDIDGFYTWEFSSAASRSRYSGRSGSVYYNVDQSGYQDITLTLRSRDGQCSAVVDTSIYVERVQVHAGPVNEWSCKRESIFEYRINDYDTTKYTYNWFDDQPINTEFFYDTLYLDEDSVYYGDNSEVIQFYDNYNLQVTSKAFDCSIIDSNFFVTIIRPNARLRPLGKVKGCAPLEMEFADSSSGVLIPQIKDPIEQWTWVFGDGDTLQTDNFDNVSHTYENPGEYGAYIKILDTNGCMDTSYAVIIEVGEDLTNELDFTFSPSELCVGEQVAFEVTSPMDNIDAFHFGTDENHISHCGLANPVLWQFNDETGTTDVTLTVDYNGCFSEKTVTDALTIKGPIARMNYEGTCDEPFKYAFESLSENTSSIKWEFENGDSSLLNAFTYTFDNTINYDVTLTASDPTSGCPDSRITEEIKVRVPTASIDADTSLCIGVEYPFVASASSDAAGCSGKYSWLFPDEPDRRPYVYFDSSPLFSFDQSGEQSIQLVVQDIHGCKDTATFDFKVYDMQVDYAILNLDGSTNDLDICNPDTLSFKDLTVADTTLSSWRWVFGDKTFSNLGDSVVHTYSTVPDSRNFYRTFLTVTDELGCSETDSVDIDWYKPTSQINGDLFKCQGETVNLFASEFNRNGDSLSFFWDYGNGRTSTLIRDTLTYDSIPLQDYEVKMIYTEVRSQCRDSVTATVRFQSYPEAQIATDADTTNGICVNSYYDYQDASISDFQILSSTWNMGDGRSTITNTDILYNYLNGGKYNIWHRVATSYGCADTIFSAVEVKDPQGDFVILDNTDKLCVGDSLKFELTRRSEDVTSWTWVFGDGTVDSSSVNEELWHTYDFRPPTGQVTARLIVSANVENCEQTSREFVLIENVYAGFGRNTLLGDSARCLELGGYPFTDSTVRADHIFWNFGDVNNSDLIEGEANPVHEYDAAGTYLVTQAVTSDVSECVDTIRKEVVVHPTPVVEAIGDSICQGDDGNVYINNAVASTVYTWTPNSNLSNGGVGDSLITSAFGTEQYSVVAVDSNTCTNNDSTQVVVIEPIGLADWDTTIVIGDSVYLPVYANQDVYSYAWSPEQGLTCLDCDYPGTRPLGDTIYELIVTDDLGCFQDNYQFGITVRPETKVRMPDTFTPNGDNINDVVYVGSWGVKELVAFQIYTRWGDLIYETQDVEEGWDGTYDGVLQNADVYVYKVKAITWRDEVLEKEGYINLVH